MYKLVLTYDDDEAEEDGVDESKPTELVGCIRDFGKVESLEHDGQAVSLDG